MAKVNRRNLDRPCGVYFLVLYYTTIYTGLRKREFCNIYKYTGAFLYISTVTYSPRPSRFNLLDDMENVIWIAYCVPYCDLTRRSFDVIYRRNYHTYGQTIVIVFVFLYVICLFLLNVICKRIC